MQILYPASHIHDNGGHGIGVYGRRLLEGLRAVGHTTLRFDEVVDWNTRDSVVLLPANGTVGISNHERQQVYTANLPVVSILFDIIPYVLKGENKWLIIDTLQISSRIITISHSSAQDIKRNFSNVPPVHVMYPNITLTPTTSDQARPDYLLAVGVWGERKGHTDLLKAILDNNNHHRLVMPGRRYYHDWVTHDLAGKARSRGLLEEPGYLTDQELAELYSKATALIYPSEYEGFGLPIVEAMACGCPVITRRHGAMLEAGADAARYIDDTSPANILSAIQDVVENRGQYRERGFERYHRLPSWDDIVRFFCDTLMLISRR